MIKKVLTLLLIPCSVFLSGCSIPQDAISTVQNGVESVLAPAPNPLSFTALKAREYPGSELQIESELTATATYTQYVASYMSDGLKIFGLLAIPKGTPPDGGWPAIIFNHGYIPPEQYRTTEKYEAYVGGFASKGFVVFKSDYRGHGKSEGQPTGAYFSPGYTTDVLNAMASVRRLKEVNKDRIGMWGHSMGGMITLRSLSVDRSIKAAVIWAGVVVDYPELINEWQRTNNFRPSPREQAASRSSRAQLVEQFGDPNLQSLFWIEISPWAELPNVETPIQLHHARGDAVVPWEFSQSLYDKLQALSKPSELYLYERSDHNLAGAPFSQAMSRSVKYFQEYL